MTWNSIATFGCRLAMVAMVAGASLRATPARADVLVLDSTAPGLTAGTTLPDLGTIQVPAGSKVTLLLPNGRTEVITGPRTGAVKDLSQGAPADRSLWDTVGKLLSGGGSEKGVGATRSIGGPVRAAPSGFSWQRVPIDADGNWCVQRGVGLLLERGAIGAEARVTVLDVASGAKAQVVFGATEASVPWPAEIAPKVGSFALLQPERPMRQLTLRLIDPLPERETTLLVLHGQRCQRQMQAWLRHLAGQ